MTRRNFLTQLLAVPTLSLLGSGITPVTAMAESSPKRSKALWLRQAHTDEELQVSYWKDGTLNNQAYLNSAIYCGISA
jgi:ferredoxin-NADP reductase